MNYQGQILEYFIKDVDFTDILTSMVIMILLLLLAFSKQKRLIDESPRYRFYVSGLVAKMLGAIAFCLVYLYYYKGGDTIDYFSGAICMTNLFFKDPVLYFDLIFNQLTWEKYLNYFDPGTMWPPTHLAKKKENFNVIRIASFFSIVTFKGFISSALLFSFVAYHYTWKAFELFCNLFPKLERYFALAFLFTPSYCFWGSGIMKDTISITCIAAIVVSFYRVFLSGERQYSLIFTLIVSIALLLNVKPYLMVAMVPGLTFWASFSRLQKIKSTFVRALVFPIIVTVSFLFLTTFYLQNAGGTAGYGSTEEAIKQAQVIQQDLKRSEAYGDNSFDIGTYDASMTGVITKIPVAITAGLYRPYLWEAKSPVMAFSGIENLGLLIFTIYSLIRLQIFGLFSSTFKDPILTFCLTFSLFIAFLIGLTSANFGALVRYKIPMLPYFISYFFILTYVSNKAEADIMNERMMLGEEGEMTEDKEAEAAGAIHSGTYLKAERIARKKL